MDNRTRFSCCGKISEHQNGYELMMCDECYHAEKDVSYARPKFPALFWLALHSVSILAFTVICFQAI